MNEAMVKQAVKTYFTDRFPQFSVSQECPVQFGTKNGIADVILHQPVKTEKGYFVAIAECKRWPLPISPDKAKAQLKSYMNATHTQFGVLAVGMNPQNWEFCENKFNNWFVSIDRETFEKGINNWKPINLQRVQKAMRRWKQIAAAFALAFVLAVGSVFLVWQKPPPEPIVYITRTGKKYHTYDYRFLKQYAEGKFAILLGTAQKDYEPCGICDPQP